MSDTILALLPILFASVKFFYKLCVGLGVDLEPLIAVIAVGKQRGIGALDVRCSVVDRAALALPAVLALGHKLDLGEFEQIELSVGALGSVSRAYIGNDIPRVGNGCAVFILFAEKELVVAIGEAADNYIQLTAVLCDIILHLHAVTVLLRGLYLGNIPRTVELVQELPHLRVVCRSLVGVTLHTPHDEPFHVNARFAVVSLIAHIISPFKKVTKKARFFNHALLFSEQIAVRSSSGQV